MTRLYYERNSIFNNDENDETQTTFSSDAYCDRPNVGPAIWWSCFVS